MSIWDDLESEALRSPAGSAGGRVLVVVVNSAADWQRVQRERWYRIPMARAPERVGADYLAFYLTAALGEARWAVRAYAPVQRLRLAQRRELLPEESVHPRAEALYYVYDLGAVQPLPRPIPSRRLRRVTFIPTTLPRLLGAEEISDLWERPGAQRPLQRALPLAEARPPRYTLSVVR